MATVDIAKLLAESEALINKSKTLQRKNREKCVDCKEKQALEDHLRCEDCLPIHKERVAKEREGRQLKRENKPTMEYDENGKLRYVHRRVMEEILGRKLEEHEVVTWRNGVKNDNRPENLILALKAGIPLDDLICPHCDEAYYVKSDLSPVSEPTPDNSESPSPSFSWNLPISSEAS